MTPTLDEFASEFGLELVQSSPVNSRSYVTTPGLGCERIDKYNWPKKANGSKFDTFVYAFLYADGTFSVATGSSIEAFAIASQMRRKA